jgi:predicted XRE-type DNA-binding protein
MPVPSGPPPLPKGAHAARAAKSVRALKIVLLDALAGHLSRLPMKQAELADLLGIARPRLNRLLKRKVELFGLEALATLALRAGLAVRVGVSRPYRKH